MTTWYIEGEIDYLPPAEHFDARAEEYWRAAHEVLDRLRPAIGAEACRQLSDLMNQYGVAIAHGVFSSMVRAAYESAYLAGQPEVIVLYKDALTPAAE